MGRRKQSIPPNSGPLKTRPTKCLEPFPKNHGKKGGVTYMIAGEFICVPILAAYCHLSLPYVYHVLRGYRVPSIPVALRMANALGMDVGDFIRALLENTDIRKQYGVIKGSSTLPDSNSPQSQ